MPYTEARNCTFEKQYHFLFWRKSFMGKGQNFPKTLTKPPDFARNWRRQSLSIVCPAVQSVACFQELSESFSNQVLPFPAEIQREEGGLAFPQIPTLAFPPNSTLICMWQESHVCHAEHWHRPDHPSRVPDPGAIQGEDFAQDDFLLLNRKTLGWSNLVSSFAAHAPYVMILILINQQLVFTRAQSLDVHKLVTWSLQGRSQNRSGNGHQSLPIKSP